MCVSLIYLTELKYSLQSEDSVWRWTTVVGLYFQHQILAQWFSDIFGHVLQRLMWNVCGLHPYIQ